MWNEYLKNIESIGGQVWWFRKKSSLRWKPESRNSATNWKNWIPAFAGMTKKGVFRLFTSSSTLNREPDIVTYIFLHLSFDIHLKFELWPLSFEFILFTYLDLFRITIQATPSRGGSWFTNCKRGGMSSPRHSTSSATYPSSRYLAHPTVYQQPF